MALDPTDRSLIARLGGADLAPAYGDLADAEVRDSTLPPPATDGEGKRRPQFDVLEYAISASGTQRVWLDYQPDWWYIRLTVTASSSVKIYRGDIASGPAINLDPATRVMLPGKLWRSLTLVAGSGATATVNVYAMDAETALRFAHGS